MKDQSIFTLPFCKTNALGLLKMGSFRLRCSSKSPPLPPVRTAALQALKFETALQRLLTFSFSEEVIFAALIALNTVNYFFKSVLRSRIALSRRKKGCREADGSCAGSVGFQAVSMPSKKSLTACFPSRDLWFKFSSDGKPLIYRKSLTWGNPRFCQSNWKQFAASGRIKAALFLEYLLTGTRNPER